MSGNVFACFRRQKKNPPIIVDESNAGYVLVFNIMDSDITPCPGLSYDPHRKYITFDIGKKISVAQATDGRIYGISTYEYISKRPDEIIGLPITLIGLLNSCFDTTLQGNYVRTRVLYRSSLYVIHTYPVRNKERKIIGGIMVEEPSGSGSGVVVLNSALNHNDIGAGKQQESPTNGVSAFPPKHTEDIAAGVGDRYFLDDDKSDVV
jgi:hypothetical protein